MDLQTSESLSQQEDCLMESLDESLDDMMSVVSQEEDELMEELDIFYSEPPTNSIFLFQYPNKKSQNITPNLAYFKHLSQQFKLDIPVNHNYLSIEQSQMFSLGLPNDQPIVKNESSKTNILDKTTLVSNHIPLNASYMVGQLNPDGLYLTSLPNILQFRPNFDYLDKIDEQTKIATQKANLDEEMEKDNYVEEEAKVVQMTVRSAEDKEMLEKMERLEMIKKQQDEKWSYLEIIAKENENSKAVLDSIFSIPHTDAQNICLTSEYMDSVSPQWIDETLGNKGLARPGLTLKSMGTLALDQKVLSVLYNAHIISFDSLKNVLDPIHEDADIIAALESSAVLVNGLWIIQSKYIYEQRVMEARNYLLFLFSKNDYVRASELNDIASLPLQISKAMFFEIAVFQKDKGWRLKLECDKNFIKWHPEVYKRQQEKIELEGERAKEFLQYKLTLTSKQAAKLAEKSIPAKASRIAIEATSTSEEYPVSGSTAKEQIINLVTMILRKHNVCSLPYLWKFIVARKTRGDHGNLINKQVTKEFFTNILEEICTVIRSLYLLKESDNPVLTDARLKAIDSFRRKKTNKLADVRKKIKGNVSYEPSDDELKKILGSIADVDDDLVWTFKSSPV